MSTAIVITSGKGGTGKTSVTGGVSACLARMGRRVLCLDADIGLRNLDLTLGMSDRAVMDFTDVIKGRCSLSDAAAAHPAIPNLYLLTAPVNLPRNSIHMEEMQALIHEIKQQFDYCLIDCPAGLGFGFKLATCGADRAVVVSTHDASSLRDAQTTVNQLRKTQTSIHLVMNRVKPKLLRQLHTTIDDAMDAAGLPLLGVVPEDESVSLLANRGIPVVAGSQKGAAKAYDNIARRLDGQTVRLMRIR